MAEPAPRQSTSDSPSAQSSAALVKDIFDLTAYSSLDLMLNKALQLLIRLLSAEAGSILFYGQTGHAVQAGAFRPEALARIQHWEKTIEQRLRSGSWHISEAAPKLSSTTLSAGQLTLVSTPVIQNTQVVGLLSFVLPPGRSLTDRQQDLLSKFSRGLGHLGALIDNLELGNQRLERIGIFYDIGQALLTTFDINKLLTDTMELATNLVDAGAASIMLIDKARGELVFKVSHGARSELIRQQRIPLEEGIAGWVARTGRPVIANDARADARFSHRVDVRTGFLTQSIAAVPLKIHGRVIGILEVLNKYADDGFNQDDIQLMSFIASQAAIAIENANLYNQLHAERDRLIAAQDSSLRQIKTNLQDKQLQFLSAIGLSLDHLSALSREANPEVMQNQIGALKTMVEQAIGNTRRLLFDLHPSILETQGLIPALEYYVNYHRKTSLVDFHFKVDGSVDYAPKTNKTIFSIIQELIDNAIQHAQASNVWLTLSLETDNENQNFIITVRDDGQGFDLDTIQAGGGKSPSLGITMITALATAINATLEIESHTQSPRRGTRARLTLPGSDQKVNNND